MTDAIYLEVSEKTEAAKKAGRQVSVSGMLKFLGVSRSGYLAWLHHVPSDTEKRRKAVKAKIQDIYDDSKQNYGAPKITVELRKTGEVISERTVGTYMRQTGIRVQWSKPWTITTKDSDFSTELQNILDEQFNPNRPNAVWCSDITYIWTIDGFVYLPSVMDLFSRKIIAWTLSKTLEVSCVIDAINKAKTRRNIDQPLIIHSDRGSQYVAKKYKKATENMQRSYSKKAFPWDNACMESFHSILKREWLNRFRIRDYNQAYRLIFEYLEAFYNTKRIHRYCDFMSPAEFEQVYKRAHMGKTKATNFLRLIAFGSVIIVLENHFIRKIQVIYYLLYYFFCLLSSMLCLRFLIILNVLGCSEIQCIVQVCCGILPIKAVLVNHNQRFRMVYIFEMQLI